MFRSCILATGHTWNKWRLSLREYTHARSSERSGCQ